MVAAIAGSSIRQTNRVGRVFTFAHQWNQLDEEGGGDLDVMALLHPTHIAHFDECWMMAAYFKELMIYQLWSDLYDVEWQFDDHRGWLATPGPAARSCDPLLCPGEPTGERHVSARSIQATHTGMATAVKEFFGDAPFIWSVGESQRRRATMAVCRPMCVDKDGIAIRHI